MKVLVFLFSVYILVLSGVACSAEDDCCMEEIAQSQNKHSQDADHKPACPCSPFFACGACHAVVMPSTTIPIVKAVQPIVKLQFCYTIQSTADYPTSVWQPPKSA
ncbi:DUF6660 family protein [Paraflavitalea pollutisoli]|uniref:DUF6660 family protein n=1 Tax=Paraflavitalea pollutisoli TaxID=3034143 RepID=UPI003B839BB4